VSELTWKALAAALERALIGEMKPGWHRQYHDLAAFAAKADANELSMWYVERQTAFWSESDIVSH
jgi:hypothetical protein